MLKQLINYKLFIFPILCLLFSYSVSAQINVTGQVHDNNGDAIEFANIYATTTQNNDLQLGTISNKNGQFSLKLSTSGQYQITISFIGFKDWQQTIAVAATTNLGMIQLESFTNDLNEVVVTAERKIIEKRDNKLVFNVAQSPLREGYDGMEVLQRSPNVLVDRNGAILLRNEAAVVKINGRITNLSGEDLANYLANINSNNIKSIEVQNQLSANVDGTSAGGVINIILKRKAVGLAGNVRSEYTIKSDNDFGLLEQINLNYGAEKWNIYGNYSFSKHTSTTHHTSSIDYFLTDNFLAEDGVWFGDHSNHNYKLGFVIDPATNHTLGIEAFGSNRHNLSDNDNLLQVSNGNDILDNGTADLNEDQRVNLYNITANYKWVIDTNGTQLQLFTDYARQDLNRNNQNISRYEQQFYTDNTERNLSTAFTDIYSVQLDFQQKIFGTTQLETGAKWTSTNRENALLSEFLNDETWIRNDRSNAFNYRENVPAAYLSLGQKINAKNYLEIGLRAEVTRLERIDRLEEDLIQQNYINWLPNVYFSHEIDSKNTIVINYSKRLRRPPFYRINNNVIKLTDFRFELGNPDLTPEYIHRVNVDWQQKNQQFSLFLRRTVDAINGIYLLEGETAFYKPFNAGSQVNYGISYNRFGNLTKWWYLKGSAGIYQRKFVNPEGIDSFEQLSYYGRMTNIFKTSETSSIELAARYQSARADAFYIAQDFYTVEMVLQKSFFAKRLNCKIYFNDIFNLLEYRNERPFDTFVSKRVILPQSQTVRLWITYNFANKNKINKRMNQSKNEARRRL